MEAAARMEAAVIMAARAPVDGKCRVNHRWRKMHANDGKCITVVWKVTVGGKCSGNQAQVKSFSYKSRLLQCHKVSPLSAQSTTRE